jgi:hypothetical protein
VTEHPPEPPWKQHLTDADRDTRRKHTFTGTPEHPPEQERVTITAHLSTCAINASGHQGPCTCGADGQRSKDWWAGYNAGERWFASEHQQLIGAALAVCNEWEWPDEEPPSETYFHELVSKLDQLVRHPAPQQEEAEA